MTTKAEADTAVEYALVELDAFVDVTRNQPIYGISTRGGGRAHDPGHLMRLYEFVQDKTHASATRIPAARTVSGSCAVQGTYSMSGDLVDSLMGNGLPQVGDNLTLTANNCSDDGESFTDGSMRVTLLSYAGENDLTLGFKATNYRTWDSQGNFVTLNVDYAIRTVTDSVAERVIISGALANSEYSLDGKSGRYEMRDFSVMVGAERSSDDDIWTYQARVSSDDIGGSLATQTKAQFHQRYYEDAPYKGQVLFVGADNAKVRMTALSDTNVFVEYDIDPVDGVYEIEETRSTWPRPGM